MELLFWQGFSGAKRSALGVGERLGWRYRFGRSMDRVKRGFWENLQCLVGETTSLALWGGGGHAEGYSSGILSRTSTSLSSISLSLATMLD